MRQILILSAAGEIFDPLKSALQDRYALTTVHDPDTALQLLSTRPFDLVIATAFQDIDIFKFTKTIKTNPELKDVPVICFSSKCSLYTSVLNPTCAHTAHLCGAQKYIAMDSFCPLSGESIACDDCPLPHELCNFPGLRLEIEKVLKKEKRSRKTRRSIEKSIA